MIAKKIGSLVFFIKAKIDYSSAPNHIFFGNKRSLIALITITFVIKVKINDKAALCQFKCIMLSNLISFLLSVVAILGIF